MQSLNEDTTALPASAGSAITIESVFHQAIDMELKVCELYRVLSRRFGRHPFVSDFWANLAEDEKWHAAELRRLLHSLSPEQTGCPPEKNVLEKLEEARRLTNRLSLETIRTLHDAYQMAHELESSELNCLFKLLAEKFIPSQARFRLLVGQVTEHQDKLTAFANQFSSRQALQEIAAL